MVGQKVVSMFGHYTGVKAIAGRHDPGTFSNKLEPCLLIVTDPIIQREVKKIRLTSILV